MDDGDLLSHLPVVLGTVAQCWSCSSRGFVLDDASVLGLERKALGVCFGNVKMLQRLLELLC